MENKNTSPKIRIGITHGDTNGVGYEIIFKAFEDNSLCEFCVPIVYGSAKVASYHRKALESSVNYRVISKADEADAHSLNLLNCMDDEIKVELGSQSSEAGRAAFVALERAVADYKAGLIDAIVTAPINKASIQSPSFKFNGHTEYFAERFGGDPLMVMTGERMRVALVTTHVPLAAVPGLITTELVLNKLRIFYNSLRSDFLLPAPRIAVLALNPHGGDDGLLGKEESTAIQPAIEKASAEGISCFGPYAADGFFASGAYRKFDGVLAMYHDQGLAPFKALATSNGVNVTSGLNVVRTSPDHGTAFDIAGKGVADEASMRHAIYEAIDIFRNRNFDNEGRANPLPKLYHDRREDSDRPRRFSPSSADPVE